jgi:threonine/homoserine/homoserine lactone efflux protein
METGALAAFWLLSFALVMTPGADWAYAISAGTNERAVLPAVLGMLLGYLMNTVVVAAGVGTLVTSFPGLLRAFTFLGSTYLLWLGAGALLHPASPAASIEPTGSIFGWILRGVGVSGLNPKALLMFLAMLPQFTSKAAAWPIPLQIAAMGLIQIVNCGVIYSFVGFASKAVLRTRPGIAQRVSQLSGFSMVVIALVLLLEQITR